MQKRILILDSYNLFVRNYVVNPALNPQGEPIGACLGFLKSLQKLCREIKPDMIIAAWDGSGGSKRKRLENKNYKEGRKPIQMNRNIEQHLSPDEEQMNRHWQWTKVVQYLNEFPVIQLLQEEVEADDIIAEVVRLPLLKEHVKIIVSTDKDFLQLCNDDTIIYQPIQNKTITEASVVRDFDIHPTNFVLARAIVGDSSDNLAGIRGAGMKSVAKSFPELRESKTIFLKDIFSACKEKKDTKKIFSSILQEKEKVEQNYRLMQLYSPNIPLSTGRFILSSISDFKSSFNKTNFTKMLIEDGFYDLNWSDLELCFKKIVGS